MVMSVNTLRDEFIAMPDTLLESEAAFNLSTAWEDYMLESAAGAAAALAAGHDVARGAMETSLAGMSAPGASIAIFGAAIQTYWTTLAASPATAYTGATVITPPPGLSGIPAALTPVFLANTVDELSKFDSCTAVAAAIHPLNLGGTATIAAVPVAIT